MTLEQTLLFLEVDEMSKSNSTPFICKCGHELQDHVKFEEIEEGSELKHKCHGKTSDRIPCPCKSLERA